MVPRNGRLWSPPTHVANPAAAAGGSGRVVGGAILLRGDIVVVGEGRFRPAPPLLLVLAVQHLAHLGHVPLVRLGSLVAPPRFLFGHVSPLHSPAPGPRAGHDRASPFASRPPRSQNVCQAIVRREAR